jgi:very-short-patch-repair endonuclease
MVSNGVEKSFGEIGERGTLQLLVTSIVISIISRPLPNGTRGAVRPPLIPLDRTLFNMAIKNSKYVHKNTCLCPFCKAKRGEMSGINNSMYGHKDSKERIEAKRICMLGDKNPAKRPEVRAKLKGYKQTPEHIKKRFDSLKETRKKPEIFKKFSEITKNHWKKIEYVRKICGVHKQNKKEKILEDIINNIFLNEYKYVGTGDIVVIDGKIPDFINVNGKNKVIELFGDYWHKGEDINIKINFYKENGYDALVIWEKELKNEKEVAEKIINFTNNEHS